MLGRRSGQKVIAKIAGIVVLFTILPAPFGKGQNETGPVAPENAGKPVTTPFHCTSEDLDWAGLTCSADEPCPVYLEISNVEAVGSRIFAAGNLHLASVTLHSELLESDDSGRTWREAAERVRGAALDRIQFVDSENGWISGGSIYPLARDPFLLATDDGGNTWRRRPLFGEEGQTGSILQFGFTSRSEGSLILDRGASSGESRYARYESKDGGATWAVSNVSAKPSTPESGPASDWRARVDNSTRSFQIEKRLGGRWARVASLAVKIGFCGAEPR